MQHINNTTHYNYQTQCHTCQFPIPPTDTTIRHPVAANWRSHLAPQDQPCPLDHFYPHSTRVVILDSTHSRLNQEFQVDPPADELAAGKTTSQHLPLSRTVVTMSTTSCTPTQRLFVLPKLLTINRFYEMFALRRCYAFIDVSVSLFNPQQHCFTL